MEDFIVPDVDVSELIPFLERIVELLEHILYFNVTISALIFGSLLAYFTVSGWKNA